YLSSFAEFEKSLAKKTPSWLQRTRAAAIERFAELGFPTLKDEEWRFTNVAPLTKIPFKPAGTFELNEQAAQKLQELYFDAGVCSRLVFANGRYAPKLSALQPLPDGVVVASLAAMLTTQPDSVKPCLAQYADYESHAFAALNTAFIQDGAFVSIPKGR